MHPWASLAAPLHEPDLFSGTVRGHASFDHGRPMRYAIVIVSPMVTDSVIVRLLLPVPVMSLSV